LVTAMARFPARAAKMTFLEVEAAIMSQGGKRVRPYRSPASVATGTGPCFQGCCQVKATIGGSG
jgi:hypothetical protein